VPPARRSGLRRPIAWTTLARITIATSEPELAAVVSVRDTGAGIPADVLPRVFDLFVQAQPAVGQALEGFGIGLTLARSLVEKHGGSIAARSDGPGRGGEFVVTMPLAVADAAVVAARERLTARAIRCRVLVVGDNRDAADSFAMLLGMLGAEVRVAYEGRSALRAIDEDRPQVTFLDAGLPDIDGREVARRVRGTPRWRETVLGAMTGWGQEKDRLSCLDAGFDHHLVKPADIDALEGCCA
jgi:CheY-like chemotaxis protein